MRFHIEIVKQVPLSFSLHDAERLTRRILKDFQTKLGSHKQGILSLVFVSDATIRKLNKTYRKKNKSTDVLSFSYLGQGEEIGELVISVDTLKRQAKEQGHPFAQEAKILIVHGLLHILGFDHEKKVDLKEMLRYERKYLGDKAGLIERSGVE